MPDCSTVPPRTRKRYSQPLPPLLEEGGFQGGSLHSVVARPLGIFYAFIVGCLSVGLSLSLSLSLSATGALAKLALASLRLVAVVRLRSSPVCDITSPLALIRSSVRHHPTKCTSTEGRGHRSDRMLRKTTRATHTHISCTSRRFVSRSGRFVSAPGRSGRTS